MIKPRQIQITYYELRLFGIVSKTINHFSRIYFIFIPFLSSFITISFFLSDSFPTFFCDKFHTYTYKWVVFSSARKYTKCIVAFRISLGNSPRIKIHQLTSNINCLVHINACVLFFFWYKRISDVLHFHTHAKIPNITLRKKTFRGRRG